MCTSACTCVHLYIPLVFALSPSHVGLLQVLVRALEPEGVDVQVQYGPLVLLQSVPDHPVVHVDVVVPGVGFLGGGFNILIFILKE